MAIPSATDVNSKTVYLNIVNKERGRFNILTKKLERILAAKENCYDWLFARREEINNLYNINLDDYQIEFVEKQYNPIKALETKVLKLLRYPKDEDRQYIIQLAKWCSILKNEKELQHKLEVSRVKTNLTYKEFQAYLLKYYCKVHKVLLQGDAYKFGKGLGTIFLKTIDLSDDKGRRVDFGKTNANRKKLLAEGKTLYNKKEAERCEIQGTEYNGVPYVVYQDKTKEIVLDIMNSKCFTSRGHISISSKSYINLKYRGMTYQEIADKLCPTEESVANLQMDLYTKRTILKIKNPGIIQKFIR